MSGICDDETVGFKSLVPNSIKAIKIKATKKSLIAFGGGQVTLLNEQYSSRRLCPRFWEVFHQRTSLVPNNKKAIKKALTNVSALAEDK